MWDDNLRVFSVVDGRLLFVPTGRTVALAEHLAGKHDQKRHAGGRSAGLEAALAEHEDRIRHIKGGEEAVVLDAAGNVVFVKKAMGDPDGDGPMAAGMSFGKHETREFEGRVLTHNHPLGGKGMSTNDISLAVNYKAAEMRVVTPDGTVYSLRPGKTTWGPEHLAAVAPKWDEAFGQVNTKMISRIRSGDISPQQASIDVFGETLSVLAPQVGWDYQEIRR